MTISTEVGRGLVVSKDVTPQLVRVLRINESPEVIETCLELITNLAETGNNNHLLYNNPQEYSSAIDILLHIMCELNVYFCCLTFYH